MKTLEVESRMTRQTVRLVTTDDGEQTHQAYAALERLPDVDIRISYCPRSVAKWFQCPFIQDEEGLEYFGLEGIEYFVSSRSGGRLAS